MAKFSATDGIEEYISELNKISAEIEPIAKKAVYKGAGVLADAIVSEIKSIPETDSKKYFVVENGNLSNGLQKKQKEGLINGLGIAKIKNDDGYINTKISFAGYNDIKTKKYPKGQPNALIARAVVKGTSYRKKNSFIKRAINKAKSEAEEAMSEVFVDELKIYAE